MPKLYSRHLKTLACAVLAFLALAALSIDLGAQGVPSISSDERADFDFPEPTPSDDIYQAISKVFDLDLTLAPKTREPIVPLVLEDATATEALDALTRVAGHFWLALDEDSILVADDTPQNRRTYETQVIARFRLQHVEIKNAMTMVRALVGAKHVAAEEESNTLVVRDTADRVAVIRELIDRIDQPRDEVTIEVEILSLDPGAYDRLVAEDVRVEREALETLLANGEAERRLRTTAALLGGNGARVEAQGRANDDQVVGIEARFDGRVMRAERAIDLDVRLVFSHLSSDENGDGERDVTQMQRTESTWRVADGGSLLVEVPGGFGDSEKGDRISVVALSPTITRFGTDKPYDLFTVGTESNMALGRNAEPLDEAEKERIRERLRQRLREMPPPAGSGSGGGGA